MPLISFGEINEKFGDYFCCPTCGVKDFYIGPSGCGDYNVKCINGHYSTTRFPMGMEPTEDHPYPEAFSEKVL